MPSISTLDISRIVGNPNNPRTRIENVDDLVSSIREKGLLQPIIVRWTKKYDSEHMPTGYEVIAGSRRLEACKRIGLKKIECVVNNVSDEEAFELATIENIVRENMNAVDEANAISAMFNNGMSRMEISARFGKTQRWVEARRRITRLGDKAMSLLASGKINLGHAEALCLCPEGTSERWLSFASCVNPEELRKKILASRKDITKAPFDYKKNCSNCQYRSDNQTDMFWDVRACYCLNDECYEQSVDAVREKTEKEFRKAGYDPVDEVNVYEALNAARKKYSFTNNEIGYFCVQGECLDNNSRKRAEERAEELRKNGEKPKYVVDPEDAKGFLVWRNHKTEQESEEEDSEEKKLDAREERIRLDKEAAKNYVENVVSRSNINQRLANLIAHALEARCRYIETDSDGEEIYYEDSPITNNGETISIDGIEFDSATDAVKYGLTKSLSGYNGIEDESMRSFLGLGTTEETEEKILRDIDNK